MTVRGNLGWTSAAVAGTAVLQYGLFFWVARYLGAELYGVYSLAWTIAVLTGPLGDLGMSVALVRVGAQRPGALSTAFGASLAWRGILLGPVGLVAWAMATLLGQPSAVFPLLLPLVLATACDGVGTLCAAAFQAKERMAASALVLIGRNLLRGVALLAVVGCGGGPLALAWAFFAAALIGALPWLGSLRIAVGMQVVLAALRPTLWEALPFGISIFATVLHGQIDIALLGTCADSAEVGRYHASSRFVFLAQMLPQVVATATAPLSYKKGLVGLDASAQVYRIKATAFAALGLIATLALVVHGEWVVRSVLGVKYAGAEVLLVMLAPVIFVKFLASALVDTLGAIGRQGVLGFACTLALCVNVVANLLLDPSYQAMGAAAATLVSETVLLGVLAVAVHRAGIALAFGRILLHPLLAVTAAAVAHRWLGPGATVITLVLVLFLLCSLRGRVEERLLLGSLRLPARDPRASLGALAG